MGFPDFRFDASLPSFISHTDVAEYLRRYAEHFDINELIKFNTAVDMVSPILDGSCHKWRVTFSPTDDRKQQTTKEFDSVIVCNGHYNVPLIPDIPGMGVFKGEIMHSHNYRDPITFQGKRVMLLGAGASGQDIAIDISKTAEQVFLSSRKPPFNSPLPPNVLQMAGISNLTETSTVLETGEEYAIDSLLLCTGYIYDFPFLDDKTKLKVDDDQRVTPLYKHIFHTQFPSLCLIGLCKAVCPFQQFLVQTATVIAVLAEEVKLPPQSEMVKDAEEEFAERLARGMPRRYAHFMGHLWWDYIAQLVKLGEFQDPVPKGVKELYDYIQRTRVANLMSYKKEKYQLDGNDSFSIIK